jgi:hypothetical protein
MSTQYRPLDNRRDAPVRLDHTLPLLSSERPSARPLNGPPLAIPPSLLVAADDVIE